MGNSKSRQSKKKVKVDDTPDGIIKLVRHTDLLFRSTHPICYLNKKIYVLPISICVGHV